LKWSAGFLTLFDHEMSDTWHEAVDALLDADEDTEVRDVADLAAHHAADRVALLEHSHGFMLDLLHAERDALVLGVDLEDDRLDLDVADGDDLGGVLGRLVQLISETWMRPSTPSSSSTNAP
jgi:hypothetical protein